MTVGCGPDTTYEQLIALLDVIDEQEAERINILLQERTALNEARQAVEKGIECSRNFVEFAAQLRRDVEAGHMQAQAALLELLPRKFNASEFVGNLHEVTAKRKAS